MRATVKYGYRTVLCLSVGLLSAASYGQSLLNLPLEHWSYPVLDRFVVKGLIDLDLETGPVTRGEVASALRPLLAEEQKGEILLSEVDQYFLEKLENEFERELGLPGGPRRVDKPIWELEKGDDYLTFDGRIGEEVVLSQSNSLKARFSLDLFSYGARGERFVFDEKVNFTYGGGTEIPGRRPWREGTADVVRAYLGFQLPWFHLNLGRDALWWGPGRYGTLLLSDQAPSLDMVTLSTELWRMRLYGFSSLLSAEDKRWLSGHRAVLCLRNLTIGLSEVVLYSRGIPEPAYLIPLFPYYAVQHNVKLDDNILWALDVSFTTRGVRPYGELLIDDYQYESDPPAPNKVGFLGGVCLTDPFGIRDTDLGLEYVRVIKWVYTQRNPLNVYLHREAGIGHWLGPDGDNITLRLVHRPLRILSVTGRYDFTRKGEGTYEDSWHSGIDPHPEFPSGVVEKTHSARARLTLEPFWRLIVSIEGGWFYTLNLNHEQGLSSRELQGTLSVGLNL